MPPVSSPPTPSEKLDRLLHEHGEIIDVMKIARAWVGPRASEGQLKSRRSQISKWRSVYKKGTIGARGYMKPRNALKLAEAVNLVVPDLVPADYFLAERPAPETVLDEIRQEQEKDRKRYQRGLRDLKKQLADERAARKQLEEKVEELWGRTG